MKEKVLNAIADMGKKVAMSKKHVYTDNETGLWYQGVSTVSSIVPKDWLAAWGAKEAVKALGYSDYPGDTAKAEEMLAKIKTIESPEKWIELLKAIKGSHAKKSKQALVDGKAGHAWLEDLVKAKSGGIRPPSMPGGMLDRPIQQFLEWQEKNVEEWIASEALVCYPDRRYAGTLDAIAILAGGKSALIDFKFASHLGEEYYLQTAGYAACFEPYGIKFDDRVIIRLPKSVEREEWNEHTWSYEMKPNNIEVLRVPTKYEADRDAFFASLIIKGWINSVTK